MVGKGACIELGQGEIEVVNALLPSRYKLEVDIKKESFLTKLKEKRSDSKKSNPEPDFHLPIPEKRPMRERRTVAYEEIDSCYKSSEGFKKLYKILQNIKKNPLSDPFLHPVDPHEFPDYYKKIEHPINLSTIESKLKNGEYQSGYDFAMDFRQIWNNSFTYNEKDSEIYENTIELSSFFENLMRGNDTLTFGDKKNVVQDLYRKIEKLSKGFKDIQSKGSPAKVQAKVDKPMNFLEKKSLCQSIKNLDPRHLKGVLDIVKECMDIQGEELEFDIDKLPPKVCRELDVYVKQCLQAPAVKKKPTSINIEGIKTANEVTSSRLKELDSQLEQLVQQTRSEPPVTVEEKNSDEDSESSSSSDSEEAEEDIGNEQEAKPFQRIEEVSDHSNGYGSMMDFDKLY